MAYDIQELRAHPQTYTAGNNGREWIVVHYTATAASARNNCVYFSGGNRSASAHYFIDDSSIWRSVPEDDSAWHAGNWYINSRSIGIEVVSDGRDFSEGEIERLAWLVGHLMGKYHIDASHVIRHYDVADYAQGSTKNPHKLCPAPYIDAGKWAALKARITGTANGTDEEDDLTPEQMNQLADMVADRIWEKKLGGTRACDRIVGTDAAANYLKNEYTAHRFRDEIATGVWATQQNGKQMRDLVEQSHWGVSQLYDHKVPEVLSAVNSLPGRLSDAAAGIPQIAPATGVEFHTLG